MKPGQLEYHAPDTVQDAVDLLASYDGDGMVIAGGQSLMPLLNMRLASPRGLIDLNGIGELDYYLVGPGRLIVGALCRHRDIELDPEVRHHWGAVADAVPAIGHVAIRNRGTVVGSICHADPAAEWPALTVLLAATITARGPHGSRDVPAEQFFDSHYVTALRPAEVVTEVRFALPLERAGSGFVEVARRHGDFALVSVGAVIELDERGLVARARLVAGGVAPHPVRLTEAEEVLVGRVPDDAAAAMAGDAGSAAVEPPGDIHAPGAYRRNLVGTLVRRALSAAVHRISEGSNAR